MDAGTDAALTSLGDPTRARILSLMRASPDGRVLVGRLATELGLRQPTVSHHMKTLLADGIVSREPVGRQVWYSVAPDAADRVDALLGRPREAASVDLDRIAAEANASDYGLGAVVWTNNLSAAHKLARSLKAGTVRVNGGGLDPALPFGGFKQSGWGRENGREGIEAYTETKAVAIAL